MESFLAPKSSSYWALVLFSFHPSSLSFSRTIILVLGGSTPHCVKTFCEVDRHSQPREIVLFLLSPLALACRSTLGNYCIGRSTQGLSSVGGALKGLDLLRLVLQFWPVTQAPPQSQRTVSEILVTWKQPCGATTAAKLCSWRQLNSSVVFTRS